MFGLVTVRGSRSERRREFLNCTHGLRVRGVGREGFGVGVGRQCLYNLIRGFWGSEANNRESRAMY
jgi:hypothetical protein